MSTTRQMSDDPAVTAIQPKVRVSLGLVDAFKSQELLRMFAGRQISARYKQMALGMLWAMVEPLGQLLLLSLVFGVLLKVDTGGYPYPVYAFSGMAAWLLFSRATLATAGSLQDNMGLISKVYFPRLILPLAAIARELFDAILMIVILVALAIFYGFIPSARLLVLPFILCFAGLCALALGLWLTTLIIKFRDIRPMLNLLLQGGMYATPIVYSANLVPERWRFYYELNPMYWVVEFSRWALLGKEIVVSTALYWSLGATAVLLFGGLIVFSLFERISVDVQ